MSAGMTDQLRDRLALALAVVAVALGVGTLAIGRHDPGVRLAPSNEYVVVTQVNAHSQAALAGLAPGMIVVQLNGAELVDLPAFVFPADAPDGYDYETGEPVEPIGIEPERPTPLPMGVDEALTLISAPYVELAAIHPSALERGSA